MTTPEAGHPHADPAVAARGTARSLVAGVFVVMAVDVVGLVAVVLGIRWRHSSPPPGAGRPTGVAVLNVVAVIQLAVGAAALTLLGAFSSPNALQVFLATMAVSVPVLVLGVSLARHVSRVR